MKVKINSRGSRDKKQKKGETLHLPAESGGEGGEKPTARGGGRVPWRVTCNRGKKKKKRPQERGPKARTLRGKRKMESQP